MKTITDGDQILKEALEKLDINLVELVAATSIWANPEVFALLLKENGLGLWYPKVRRAAFNEEEGQVIDGVRLDNNTYAKFAIQGAIGRVRQTINLEACHIWPFTTYDERYHTCIANLILLPCCISRLSDKDATVIAALQFRAFELFDWYPLIIKGVTQQKPIKPARYPAIWRTPEEMTARIKKAIHRRQLR